MGSTVQAHRYVLGGLTLRSQIRLPRVRHARRSPAAVDVDIRLTDSCKPAQLLRRLAPGWYGGPGIVYFRVPGVGRFAIRDGREIRVAPAADAKPASIRPFLLGSAFGALCHQRGLLPLHANCVAHTDGCVAFMGDSGMGKTTLAMALGRRGRSILSDDVCVVANDDAGDPLAYPGPREVKLWDDAAAALEVSLRGRRRVQTAYSKYYVKLNGAFQGVARPLTRLYVLAEDDETRCTRLQPAEALAQIMRNTYRPFLIAPLDRGTAHFRACATLARRMPVYRFARPRQLATLAASTDVLLSHLDESSP